MHAFISYDDICNVIIYKLQDYEYFRNSLTSDHKSFYFSLAWTRMTTVHVGADVHYALRK